MSSIQHDRVSTGVEGLDTIIDGGLIKGRGYMIDGPAGVGKTILALHFLTAGANHDETELFINLEEDLDDLKANAAALGFDTAPIEFLDLSPTADVFTDDQSYSVFSAADVKQEPLTDQIRQRVRAVEPDRVVVDPLTQLRYLTSDDYQFRKQVIGFMRFLKQYDATVVFTVQNTDSLPTEDLQFISDGSILLTRAETGRRIAVPKFRGSAVQSGEHALRITDKGLVVYPALEPGDHRAEFRSESVSSGVPEIDELLHGGIERGTVTAGVPDQMAGFPVSSLREVAQPGDVGRDPIYRPDRRSAILSGSSNRMAHRRERDATKLRGVDFQNTVISHETPVS